jgi:hypothetical protein
LWLNWGAIQEFAWRGRKNPTHTPPKKKKLVSVGVPPQNSNWAPPEYKNRPLPLNQPALYLPNFQILYSIQIYFRGNGYKEIQIRNLCKVRVLLNQKECKVSPLLSILSPVPKPSQKTVINFWDNTVWLMRRHIFFHWIFRINRIIECCSKYRIVRASSCVPILFSEATKAAKWMD